MVAGVVRCARPGIHQGVQYDSGAGQDREEPLPVSRLRVRKSPGRAQGKAKTKHCSVKQGNI